MHKEIKQLIEHSLIKGEIRLSDEEKIVQKGIELGLDSFELRIYIANYQSQNTDNTKKCPDCNSNIPFMAKTCAFCGSELELESAHISESELLANLNKSVKALNSLRPFNVSDIFFRYGIIIFSISFLIASVVFMTSGSNNSLKSFLLTPLLLVFSIIATIVLPKMNTKKGAKRENISKKLANLSLIVQKNENLFNMYYSKNKDMRVFANTFYNKTETIEDNIFRTNIKAILTAIVVFMALNVYVFFGDSQQKINPELDICPQYISVESKSENLFNTRSINFVAGNNSNGFYFRMLAMIGILDFDSTKTSHIDKFVLSFVDNNKNIIEHMPVFESIKKNNYTKESSSSSAPVVNYTFDSKLYNQVIFEQFFPDKQTRNEFINKIEQDFNIIVTSDSYQ